MDEPNWGDKQKVFLEDNGIDAVRDVHFPA